jgi:hypothetical protein
MGAEWTPPGARIALVNSQTIASRPHFCALYRFRGPRTGNIREPNYHLAALIRVNHHQINAAILIQLDDYELDSHAVGPDS